VLKRWSGSRIRIEPGGIVCGGEREGRQLRLNKTLMGKDKRHEIGEGEGLRSGIGSDDNRIEL
jgi:hypothetical protein